MAAMSGAWLRKKVGHPWLCGARRLTMYLATLDCATSNPSLSSSPWMRGAPRVDPRLGDGVSPGATAVSACTVLASPLSNFRKTTRYSMVF
jgi:hypothetical protein